MLCTCCIVHLSSLQDDLTDVFSRNDSKMPIPKLRDLCTINNLPALSLVPYIHSISIFHHTPILLLQGRNNLLGQQWPSKHKCESREIAIQTVSVCVPSNPRLYFIIQKVTYNTAFPAVFLTNLLQSALAACCVMG